MDVCKWKERLLYFDQYVNWSNEVKEREKKLGDIETIDCAVPKRSHKPRYRHNKHIKSKQNKKKDVKRVKVGMSLRLEARKPAN